MTLPSDRLRMQVMLRALSLILIAVAVWLPGPGGWLLGDVKGPAGGGDDKAGGLPVPVATSFDVEVVRGGSVEITLQALTERTLGLEFEVREPPRHGSVGKPTRIPREGAYDLARVVYRSDPNGTSPVDQFVYVARLPDGPVSPAATITVRIREPRPVLEVQNTNPRIGRVLIGKASSAILVVRNVGSAVFRQSLTVDPPWSLGLSGGELEIPPGESVRIPVEFVPRTPGEHRLELALRAGTPQGGDATTVVVEGVGMAPFEVLPGTLRLVWNGERRMREGIVRIRSVMPDPVNVFVEAPSDIGIPREIEVPARGLEEVAIEVHGDAGAYRDQVLFLGGGYQQALLLEGAALPPHIELIDRDPADQGPLLIPAVEQGAEQIIAFRVANAGGEAGEFIAEASTPFFVHPEDAAFHLEPGAHRTLRIGLASPVIGKFDGAARFYCGRELLTVPLSGEVVRPKAPPTVDDGTGQILLEAHRTVRNPGSPAAVGVPPADPGKALLENPALAEFQALLFQKGISIQREYSKLVPSVERVILRDQRKKEITLAWKPPGGGDYQYVVEYERMFYVPKIGQMYKLWVPYPAAEIARKGDEIQARLTDLKPGSVYAWRVLTEEGGIGFSLPSKPVRLGTVMPRRLPWGWGLLVGLAVLLGGLLWYKRRIGG